MIILNFYSKVQILSWKDWIESIGQLLHICQSDQSIKLASLVLKSVLSSIIKKGNVTTSLSNMIMYKAANNRKCNNLSPLDFKKIK